MGSHSVRLDRRTFIAGLGAASLTPWPRAALAAPHVFDLADDIRLRIIDSAVDLTTRAEAIRLAGVKTVIRYYARGPGQWDGKVLSKPELDALEAQNLSVAVVFQQHNNIRENFLDPNKKVEDVMWARAHADALQQPEGTAVYFGADFDLQHWDTKTRTSNAGITDQVVAGVRRYFEYARDELAKDGRKVGVYGCGRTLELLEDVADYFWLSASADFWRSGEFYNSGKWHLFQNRVDLVKHYDNARPCPIDANLANPDHEDFGQWRRSGEVDVDTPEQARAVLEARSFVAVQQLGLYKNHPSRSKALLSPDSLSAHERAALRYAYNVKILTEEGDYYGVSLDEGDYVRGYCHKSDLSANMAMPLRADRSRAPRTAAAGPAESSTPAKPNGYQTASANSRKVKLSAKPAPKPATAATKTPKVVEALPGRTD